MVQGRQPLGATVREKDPASRTPRCPARAAGDRERHGRGSLYQEGALRGKVANSTWGYFFNIRRETQDPRCSQYC